MESLFVSYEQAVKLKELGFDPFLREDCLAYFNTSNSNNDLETKDWWLLRNNDFQYALSAPLKLQAIMFLLNKIDDFDDTETSIEYFGDESGSINRHLGFGTLRDAIQILIELVTNGKI